MNHRKLMKRSLLGLSVSVALAAPAMAASPYTRADESWMSLSGTVESVSAEGFMLDYGPASVAVEMDRPDGTESGYKLMTGDEVTVTGRVDDDLFETTSIEASSVYVDSLNTHFFSSSVDEEAIALATVTPFEASRTVAVGTVTSVDDGEFRLSTGAGSLAVETGDMSYDPTDEAGFQKVEIGDRVKVIGRMDADFFSGRELMADAVVTLSPLDGSMSS